MREREMKGAFLVFDLISRGGGYCCHCDEFGERWKGRKFGRQHLKSTFVQKEGGSTVYSLNLDYFNKEIHISL